MKFLAPLVEGGQACRPNTIITLHPRSTSSLTPLHPFKTISFPPLLKGPIRCLKRLHRFKTGFILPQTALSLHLAQLIESRTGQFGHPRMQVQLLRHLPGCSTLSKIVTTPMHSGLSIRSHLALKSKGVLDLKSEIILVIVRYDDHYPRTSKMIQTSHIISEMTEGLVVEDGRQWASR